MKPSKIVDAIITMYPNLEKDKSKIMRRIYKDRDIQDTPSIAPPQPNGEILFEKFCYNNTNYYRNTNGSILDMNINIVGIFDDTDKNNIICYFFDEENEKIKKMVRKI